MITRLAGVAFKARRWLNTPTAQLAIATIGLQLGVNALLNVVSDLRDQLADTTAQLAAAQAQLPGAAYPAGEDLDPLGRHDDLEEVCERVAPAPAAVVEP